MMAWRQFACESWQRNGAQPGGILCRNAMNAPQSSIRIHICASVAPLPSRLTYCRHSRSRYVSRWLSLAMASEPARARIQP